MARPEYVEITCKSAINRVQGMPYLKWSLNPYGGCVHRCRFCFAVQYRVVADQGTQQDFGTRLFIKTNFVDVLARELKRPAMQGERLTLGTATDPYQPVEGRYRLTRGALELLREHANPMSLLTKSPMVQRDVDVLADLARVASAEVYFSITTVDLDLWRSVEPGTANPFHRLRAMQTLRRAGVTVGVMMAPILPGLTDSASSIEAVAAAARELRCGALHGDTPAAGAAREGVLSRLHRRRVSGPVTAVRARLSRRPRAGGLSGQAGSADPAHPRPVWLQPFLRSTA